MRPRSPRRAMSRGHIPTTRSAQTSGIAEPLIGVYLIFGARESTAEVAEDTEMKKRKPEREEAYSAFYLNINAPRALRLDNRPQHEIYPAHRQGLRRNITEDILL
jgi:hypothetical protein